MICNFLTVQHIMTKEPIEVITRKKAQLEDSWNKEIKTEEFKTMDLDFEPKLNQVLYFEELGDVPIEKISIVPKDKSQNELRVFLRLKDKWPSDNK